MARRKKDYVKLIGIIVFIAVAIGSYIYSNHPDWFRKELAVGPVNTTNSGVVDFIDCGQGDSALLLSKDEVVLIDAGTAENSEQVIKHLQNRGIEKIDHLILSHPHEDHIGNAKEILETFRVEKVYMKKPTSGTAPTSKVYLNLLKELKDQGLSDCFVKVGDTFEAGDFIFTILGPLHEYKDLNAQSIVVRAEYGECSFLFTGDMEADAEEDLVGQYGSALRSTVLKSGHHGSSTSSSKVFMNAVAPQFAIISCGEENSYGHPHKETLALYDQMKVSVYRTDTMGTITMRTDGKTIEIQEAA